MSNWMNEAGEPYMTAAELRFEAELDELAAYERDYDAYDDFDYGDAEHTCSTGDANYRSNGDIECSFCGDMVGKWSGRDANYWPVVVEDWTE